MADPSESNDPFARVHRERRVRVVIIAAVLAGLVAIVISVVSVVFSHALDGNPAIAFEAAAPQASPSTPSSPSPSPSTTMPEDASPAANEQPAQAAQESGETRILNENQQPVDPQVGMCVGSVDGVNLPDGHVIWIVPCTWPNTSFILAILGIPANITSDDDVTQFVYRSCFVGAALRSMSERGDSQPLILQNNPISWVKDEPGGFRSMSMSQTAFRYTAWFGEDGLILCTEGSTTN